MLIKTLLVIGLPDNYIRGFRAAFIIADIYRRVERFRNS